MVKKIDIKYISRVYRNYIDGIGTYIVDTKLIDRVGMNEAGINYIGGGGVRPKLVRTT
jgi:hypothetical protein